MAPRTALRRSLLPVLIAVVIAAGSSVATSALGPGATRPASIVTSPSIADATTPLSWTTPAPVGPPSIASRPGLARLTLALPPPIKSPAVARTRPTPKPQPARATPRPPTHVSITVGSVYKGRNHVWMPSLGINRSVSWYACGTPQAPGLGVYRWGCAGANNVYLLAHAYAAFKGLHDAYVGGRLRKGMLATYADGSGRVRTYAVVWWRLATPDNGAFAYAAQSRPSMTLQTCVGSRNQYRLIVRLVAVG